jgi:hypothetical protein
MPQKCLAQRYEPTVLNNENNDHLYDLRSVGKYERNLRVADSQPRVRRFRLWSNSLSLSQMNHCLDNCCNRHRQYQPGRWLYPPGAGEQRQHQHQGASWPEMQLLTRPGVLSLADLRTGFVPPPARFEPAAAERLTAASRMTAAIRLSRQLPRTSCRRCHLYFVAGFVKE